MKRAFAIGHTRAFRRGITIIETMVVVSGAALLLGLCAVSLQLLMKLDTDSHARFAESVAFERLGRQLRDDVHASRTASLAADAKTKDRAPGLRLAFESARTVSYDFGDGGVVRTESRGEKAVRHERYSLAKGAQARFELRDEASRRLVALVMTRPPGKSQTEPSRAVELVALEGKHSLRAIDEKRSKP
jgi:hypothetical protein